jgi:predicted methyltransferase
MRLNASALLIVAALLAASPGFAFDTNTLGQGGSLPLSDLAHLIASNAKLKAAVAAALAKTGKKADDIICGGNRFPREWVDFGGRRVAPYACDFNGKWLVIDAKVTITGPDGKIYGKVSRDAMAKASKVSETDLTWHWTDKEPDNP